MERLWAGTPIGAYPRRRFASFAAVGKGGRPAGRNPARCGAPSRRALRTSRPTGTGGPVSRPYDMERKSPNEPAGGASPSPTGRRGNIPRRRTRKAERPAGPFLEKGVAGLNYHKMYDNVPLLTSARHGWRCFLWQAITQNIFLSINGSRTIR